MLWLAHDGSLNAEWLSHYAVRFAKRLERPEVHALFVEDGSALQTELDGRLGFLQHECASAGVTLSSERLPLSGSVTETLLARIPPGRDSYLLCGLRARPRGLRILSGTVSEKLLAARHCSVLAVRIVHPGIMGAVHRVLVPVMGHPRGFASGIPFMKLLASNLDGVHVLMVLEPSRPLRRLVTRSHAASRAWAQNYVERVQQELAAALGPEVHLDTSLVEAPHAALEIVLEAKQHRSQLIYLGASERSLARRLFSGVPFETVLNNAPCDVAIYRGLP